MCGTLLCFWLLNSSFEPSEKASIDEAFIDFTKPVRDTLLERYPYIATVPPDAPMGIDSPLPPPPPVDWEGKGTVVPVHPSPPAESKADGEDAERGQPEAGPSSKNEPDDFELHAEDDNATTWHDVALSIASEMMMKARQEVLTRLGYSTSAVR